MEFKEFSKKFEVEPCGRGSISGTGIRAPLGVLRQDTVSTQEGTTLDVVTTITRKRSEKLLLFIWG